MRSGKSSLPNCSGTNTKASKRPARRGTPFRRPKALFANGDDASTYIQEPPYFVDMDPETPTIQEIRGARVLAKLGDSTTTDHISPAGSIARDAPAGKYLTERGVAQHAFNSYGSRRGNHEVMIRGTFANIRIKNLLVPGTEGGVTRYFPTDETMSIYDAAMKYADAGVPLVVLGGKDYGDGIEPGLGGERHAPARRQGDPSWKITNASTGRT